MKQISHSRNGFTLVELLMATLILAGTLTGLIQVFIQCSFLAEYSRSKTIAITVAQSKIEEIRGAPYTSIARWYASACPCDDDVDNEDSPDGLIDYPADAGCSPAVRTKECSDGIDNDGNGVVDFSGGDADCSSALDNDEGGFVSEDTREDYECDDEVDNDGNGYGDHNGFTGGTPSVVYPADGGCSSATDDHEGYLPSVSNGACTGTFDVTELKGGSGTIAIDAGNPNITEVQVTVSWTTKKGRSTSETLTTFISKR